MFSQYNGASGLIKDLTLADITSPVVDPFIIFNKVGEGLPDDLVVDSKTAYTFTLTSLGFPVYTATTNTLGQITGTSVSVGFSGFFTHYGDGSGDITEGGSTVSIDFAGLNPNQVRALFDAPGETPNRTFNWSANIEAVPEPMTMLGVATAGGIGGLFRKMRKNK